MNKSLFSTYGYHLLAIVTAVIWGTTFVSTKILINYGLRPEEIMLYRFIIAYFGIIVMVPRPFFARNWRDELLFVVAGITGGSFYFLAENTALRYTLASNVSILISVTPLMTAVLSHYLFGKEQKTTGESLSRRLLYGSLIAIGGVFLVVLNGRFLLKVNPLGDALTLLAALLWAFYSMVLRKFGNHYSALFITRKVFFYGIITILPFFAFSPIRMDWNLLLQPVVAANLIFLSLIASLACYLVWNIVVRKLGVVSATNYIYLNPVSTLITSSIVLNEHITSVAILGSVLVLYGVYVAKRGFSFPKKTKI